MFNQILKIMNLQNATKETLEYLFEGYKLNPTAIFDISEVVEKYGLPLEEFGNLLLGNGWVRNQRFGGNSFSAQITLSGWKFQSN